MSSLHGDFRAACSRMPAARTPSAATSTHEASRSLTDPSVAPAAPAPSPSPSSVHACGISRLVPSGSTTSNSRRPCRRSRPVTGSTWPSSTSRLRVTRTSVTPLTAARPQNRPQREGPGGQQRAAPHRRPGRYWPHPGPRPRRPQIDRHSRSDARGEPQDLTLATRARQGARIKRTGHGLEIDRRHHPAAERFPAEFHADLPEIGAIQPQPVPDQQLNGRLSAEQALRPHPQRGDKVFEARSVPGLPSTRSSPARASRR